MAECQLPKLNTRVRFPSPAPESRNNLDVKGGEPRVPSCFGFLYPRQRSRATDVFRSTPSGMQDLTPDFWEDKPFISWCAFSSEKGHLNSRIFCLRFRRRFYGRCKSPYDWRLFSCYREWRNLHGSSRLFLGAHRRQWEQENLIVSCA